MNIEINDSENLFLLEYVNKKIRVAYRSKVSTERSSTLDSLRLLQAKLTKQTQTKAG